MTENWDQLTRREDQVCRSIVSGLNYKEVAAKLGASPSTIRVHLRSAYLKLEVHNVAQLCREAMAAGVLIAPTAASETPRHG